jgi:hypothetical protein
MNLYRQTSRFLLDYPKFVIYFHFLMCASLTPPGNAFTTMFLFLHTPISFLYFYTTFPMHIIGYTHTYIITYYIILYYILYNSTYPDLILFLTVLGEQFSRSLIHFFSLMSHIIILVYNHVTLCIM